MDRAFLMVTESKQPACIFPSPSARHSSLSRRAPSSFKQSIPKRSQRNTIREIGFKFVFPDVSCFTFRHFKLKYACLKRLIYNILH